MSGTPSTYTRKGIAAIKAGNRSLARQFLNAAIDDNPEDELAWLWMSSIVTTSEEKRECLKRVLEINPDNTAARRGLQILGPEPIPEPVGPPPAPAVQPPAASDPLLKNLRDVKPARKTRRGRWLLLALPALTIVGGAAVILVLLANRNPAASPSSQQPAATSQAPATWTPTPTPPPTATPTPRPAPTQLQPLVNEAVRLRELQPLRSIHYVTTSQFDVDLYLRNDIDAQSVVLANTFWNEVRALGLVDYALEYDRQRVIDLTSRRLAGFYSPAEETLYAVTQSSRVDASEYVVIVHEYVHALADMHFDLDRLLFAAHSTDADLAARALAEGDATLVENSTPWSFYGPDGWEDYAQAARAFVPELRELGVSTAFVFIQSFPYVEGWAFVWALRDGGGWEAVNSAYDRIPESTEQILHPDRYLATESPRALSLPPSETLIIDGYTQVVEQDTLGEFVMRVLLDEFIADEERAARAAEGWGGDAFRAWIDPVGNTAYAWLTAWDDEDQAREFVLSAAEMMSSRTNAFPPVGPGVDQIYFDGDQGRAYISRSGDQVLIVWSARAGVRDEILAAFPDF